MAGSSQPQHFFAAGCVFANFAISVIFYPVIKTLRNLFADFLRVYTTLSDIEFESKNQFCKIDFMHKNCHTVFLQDKE